MSYTNKKKHTIGIWKSIFVIYTIVLFFLSSEKISYNVICSLTYFNLFFGGAALWENHDVRMSNGAFLFWVITFIFSFGQNLAYPMITDVNSVKNELLYHFRYNDEQMAIGTLYTLRAFNLMSLGLMSKGVHFTLGELERKLKTGEYEIAISAGYIGRILMLLGIIPQVQFIYLHLIQYLTMGYGESAVDQMSGLFLRLHYLFIPALIICFCSNRYRNKSTTIYTMLLLIQVVFFLLMGDRGTGLTLLVTFMFMNAAFDKNFSAKKYILPSIIIVFLIPIVKYYRIFFTQGGTGAITEAISYSLKNNPIVDILLETGGSQKILLLTISKVKQAGLAYGKAYLDFFVKMIPSFFGIKTNYGTLAKWVIGTTGYQTQGYSIWGEAYLNFGQFGILFMFFIGGVFRYLLYTDEDNRNLFQTIRVSIALHFFADVARRSISEFGYNFLYDLILPLIVIYLCALSIQKRECSHDTEEKTFC